VRGVATVRNWRCLIRIRGAHDTGMAALRQPKRVLAWNARCEVVMPWRGNASAAADNRGLGVDSSIRPLHCAPMNGELHIPISYGELIDKITILEIKAERIADTAKLKNIAAELALLNSTWSGHAASRHDIHSERARLKAVNEALWQIEDDIRLKEKARAFDAQFIELARAVYIRNDERAAIKREINLKLGSNLVEEKSYQDYRS